MTSRQSPTRDIPSGEFQLACPGPLCRQVIRGRDLDDATRKLWEHFVLHHDVSMRRYQNEDLLTEEEHEAMALSGKLAGKLRRIIGDGPQARGDWAEAAYRIHSVQAMILAQAASRAYPDRYRALGGWQESDAEQSAAPDDGRTETVGPESGR